LLKAEPFSIYQSRDDRGTKSSTKLSRDENAHQKFVLVRFCKFKFKLLYKELEEDLALVIGCKNPKLEDVP
jgi:hypothetical protein